MKHAQALAVLPALVLGIAVHSLAFAYPWLGTITSLDGGAFNNTTSVIRLSDAGVGSQAFTLGYGLMLGVQCDNDACIQSSPDAGFKTTCASSSTSHGVSIKAGQLFPVQMTAKDNVVSMVPADAGAANCDAFNLSP